MDINQIFKIAIDKGASDVHLISGLSPILRIDGNLISITKFQDLDNFKSSESSSRSTDFNVGKEENLLTNNKQNSEQREGDLLFRVYDDEEASVERYILSENNELINSEISESISSLSPSLEAYDLSVVSNKEMIKAIRHILSTKQINRFKRKKDLDFSYQFEKYRFRSNLSFEKGNIKMTSRIINDLMPTMESLDMPAQVYNLLNFTQGLILVTGPTGSGKSTSLAAMIDHINAHRSCNIVTFEDPIEFVFQPKKSIISQRQLETDMPNFASGLRHVLRQDPNVIMLGEMRDLETISTAITLAETGHLVLATLHTCNAAQTIDRIIDIFPPHQQSQIKAQLSLILSAVISQVLVPSTKGGRIAVRELLLNNSAVSNLIREQKISQIKSVIETHSREGMISFERSIKDLLSRGLISTEIAQGLLANKLFVS